MHLNLRADMEKTLAFDPIMFSKLRVVSLNRLLVRRPVGPIRACARVNIGVYTKNAFSACTKLY